jgi:hypothetical protein
MREKTRQKILLIITVLKMHFIKGERM